MNAALVVALGVLGAAYLVLFGLLVVLVSSIRSQQSAWQAERAQLVRAVIAKNATEALGLEAAARPRRARAERVVDPENNPPPGTQPIGLDGS